MLEIDNLSKCFGGLTAVNRVSTRIEAGRIVLEGDYDSLSRNEAVRRAYIGG
jgi:ABC-type branched-subunit amino acid transport system ATPase component